MPNTNPAKMKNPPQSPALSGFQPQNHPLDSTKTLKNEPLYLRRLSYQQQCLHSDPQRHPLSGRAELSWAGTSVASANTGASRKVSVRSRRDIDLTSIRGIERGRRNPSLPVRARIADALSVLLPKLPSE